MRTEILTGAMAALIFLTAASPAMAGAPVSHARAELLLDGLSGQVVYQQNGSAKAYPASTTKLLTALVAVEHGKLDQVIAVSGKAVDQPPGSSSCYLEKGERQRLDNLLYGLLLVSGNDCAQAIAEGVSGGKPEQFIAWMNETAKRLGATHSNFTNPHGLHDPNHYTTPLDLALIARAALSNSTLLKISGTKEFYWPGKSERNGLYFNHNQMLSTYRAAIGGKNGYTEEAGLTLVVAAKRENRLLVGVVMGEDNQINQYNDLGALLDYGFNDFEQKPLLAGGSAYGNILVTGGKAATVEAVVQGNFPVTLPRGGKANVAIQPKLQESVAAPVKQGQPVGQLEIREGDRVIGTVPVVAAEAVPASPFTLSGLLGFGASLVKWVLYLFLGLLLFRTIVKVTRRALRRRRRAAAGYGRRGYSSGANSVSAYRTRDRY